MPKVKFVVEHLQVEVEAGRRLRAIALDAGVYPNREFLRGVNCGGRGICGTCKVWVHPASDRAVNAPNTREKIHGAGGGRRLACQTQVLGDVEVTTMPGGDDRLDPKRKIGPAPAPVQDADAVRKPIDEASSIAWPLGHPSKVGSGKMPESAPEESVKSVSKPVASKVSAPTDKPAESKSEPATDTSVGTKPSELVSQSGESNGERAASAAAAGKGDEPAGS
jgi:ferredoxin